MPEASENKDKEPNYESTRVELEAFLPSVGEQILELRRSAEVDPNFTRLKADKSIVTKADVLSEDIIRAWIEDRFPEDSIRGEEREQKKGGTRNWIVDPIDGTYNFNNFGNKFGISVGLVENNVPKLGVIFYPAECISVSASEGAGALINGEALETSKGVTQLDKSHLIFTIPETLPSYFDKPHFKKTIEQQRPLVAVTDNEDLDWSFTFSFLKFLQNKADAILHFGATPYDIAGAVAIAKELGLEISGFDGRQLDFSKDIIPVVISKNPELHKVIIDCLNY